MFLFLVASTLGFCSCFHKLSHSCSSSCLYVVLSGSTEMFSVLHRLLQMVLGGFLLKKVMQMVKWVCRLPCNNFSYTLQHQPSNVVTPVCCGRKWELRSNELLLPLQLQKPQSSTSVQSIFAALEWYFCEKKIPCVTAKALLPKFWISWICLWCSFDRGERSCKSCLVVFPLTQPLQWSWADGNSGNYWQF